MGAANEPTSDDVLSGDGFRGKTGRPVPGVGILFPRFGGHVELRDSAVRRAHFSTIIAAWIVTVPAAALLAGGIFMILGTLR